VGPAVFAVRYLDVVPQTPTQGLNETDRRLSQAPHFFKLRASLLFWFYSDAFMFVTVLGCFGELRR